MAQLKTFRVWYYYTADDSIETPQPNEYAMMVSALDDDGARAECERRNYNDAGDYPETIIITRVENLTGGAQ